MSTRYLKSIADLRANAAADLGPMDAKGYDDFMAEARRLAPAHGVGRVRLVIEVELKEANALGVKEQPYPINADEWETILGDARTMCVSMPHVFLVDGEKFTAPI